MLPNIEFGGRGGGLATHFLENGFYFARPGPPMYITNMIITMLTVMGMVRVMGRPSFLLVPKEDVILGQRM